jgi:hypothetical protein
MPLIAFLLGIAKPSEHADVLPVDRSTEGEGAVCKEPMFGALLD